MLSKESLTPLTQPNLGKGVSEFLSGALGFDSLLHPLDPDFPVFALDDLGLEGMQVRSLWVVGSLDAEEVRGHFGGRYRVSPEQGLGLDRWGGLLVAALELPDGICPNRTMLSDLLRRMNRKAKGLPVVAFFRYGDAGQRRFSVGAIERKEWQTRGDGERLGKVSLLRDVELEKSVHQGHLRILDRMRLDGGTRRVISLADLESHWREVFSVQVLNREFYERLFDWYLWAKDRVHFPNPSQSGVSDQENSQRATLRFITRMLFTWFLRARHLLPEELFSSETMAAELVGFSPEGSKGTYYNAVLQNLFFACFNAPWRGRDFLPDGTATGYNDAYMDHTRLRGRELFRDPQGFLARLQNIPELNAGLFECLDYRPRHQGKNLDEERWDGFSNIPSKRALIPDVLLWGNEREEDVSGKGVGTCRVRVKGLIPLLDGFIFTVEENTPEVADAALDPELLGRVFENLLAAVNPETTETARKTTGSFYTPREVVHFMADEALRGHLSRNFDGNCQDDLDALFAGRNPFDADTTHLLVRSLSQCRILDPACGSGAFPMGMLERMVTLLRTLDPENRLWKEELLQQAEQDLQAARSRHDHTAGAIEARIAAIRASFGRASFEENYTRKLYLIENCIYGVDIQPIAVQITLLRFFLALLIDQRIDHAADNQGVVPLPNLGTKFVVADSLRPLTSNVLQIQSVRVEEITQELREIQRDLFYAQGWREKKRLQDRLDDLQTELVASMRDCGMPDEAAARLAEWRPQDSQRAATFFDPDMMFGLRERFDVVIGNPPYVVVKKDEFLERYSNYKLIKGKPDLYRTFMEAGIDWVKNDGHFSYIVPNTIMSIPAAKVLRIELFKNVGKLEYLVEFVGSAFSGVCVNSAIIGMTSRRTMTPYEFRYLKVDDARSLIGCDFTRIGMPRDCDVGTCVAGSNTGLTLSELQKKAGDCFAINQLFSKIELGSQVYHNTIHGEEVIKSRIYHSKNPIDGWKIEIGGTNVVPMKVDLSKGNEWVNVNAEWYRPLNWDLVSGKRLLIRESVNPRIMCGVANDVLYPNKSVFILKIKCEKYLRRVAVYLNSFLPSAMVMFCDAKARQNIQPRVSKKSLDSILVPKSVLQTDELDELTDVDLCESVNAWWEMVDAAVASICGITEIELSDVYDTFPKLRPIRNAGLIATPMIAESPAPKKRGRPKKT